MVAASLRRVSAQSALYASPVLRGAIAQDAMSKEDACSGWWLLPWFPSSHRYCKNVGRSVGTSNGLVLGLSVGCCVGDLLSGGGAKDARLAS